MDKNEQFTIEGAGSGGIELEAGESFQIVNIEGSQVVDLWASEEEFFNHKKRKYRFKEGQKYGHYSQIIWAKTTKIGAAVRLCKDGSQIWVCNYDPPGNYIDEEVY